MVCQRTMPEVTRYLRPLRPFNAAPGRVVAIGDETLHIVERGAGEPVVLIHGLLGNTTTWRNITPALASRHRVIAVDLVGFGHSSRSFTSPLTLAGHASRVVAMLDALGFEHAAIVGHSLGGAVAQHIAVSHPQRISRLALIASLHAGDAPVWGNAARRAEAAARYAAIGLRVPPAVRLATARALRQLAVDPASVDRDQVLNYSEPLCRPGTLAAFRALFASVDREPGADLHRIATPTLVISAGRDTSIPVSTGTRLASAIAGAQHVVIEGAGHLCAEEHGDEVTALLCAFLATNVDASKEIR